MNPPRVTADSPELRSLDNQIMQAESQNRWQDAARLLRTRAQRVAPPQEAVRTLEHLVSVYRVKLMDERGAVQAAEELVRTDPSHAAARQYLAESYTRSGDQAKLQTLQTSAPQQAQGGGFLGAITGALSSAATAAGAAATNFAGAVEASNRDPEWMRTGGVAPPQSAQPQRTAAPAAQRPASCPYCGNALGQGARACGACGAEL